MRHWLRVGKSGAWIVSLYHQHNQRATNVVESKSRRILPNERESGLTRIFSLLYSCSLASVMTGDRFNCEQAPPTAAGGHRDYLTALRNVNLQPELRRSSMFQGDADL